MFWKLYIISALNTEVASILTILSREKDKDKLFKWHLSIQNTLYDLT